MQQRWTMKDIEKTGLKITGGNRIVLAEKKNVPRAAKYGNIKIGGFDSKKEAEYYNILKLKEKAGLVTGIQTQVVFQLSVCKYISDFVFFDIETGAWKVVDVKSKITRKLPVYKLKKKMMLNELNIEILEV